MQTCGSKFMKYQELKIQEHNDQVPIEYIHPSMTVVIGVSLSEPYTSVVLCASIGVYILFHVEVK